MQKVVVDVREGPASPQLGPDATSAQVAELLGSYGVRRGGWRPLVLAAAVMVVAVVLDALVFGEDRGQVIAQSSWFAVLIVVFLLPSRRRQPHTTITREGLEVLPSVRSRTRRASWPEVREVRPAAPLRVSGDVLLATGEEVPLVGMKRADVEQLADLLDALQQPTRSDRPT